VIKGFRAKNQCRSVRHYFDCQGVSKHEGPHWCYDELGWLYQWPSKAMGSCAWGFSMTPPDHVKYIHPKDKIHESARFGRSVQSGGRRQKKEKRKEDL